MATMEPMTSVSAMSTINNSRLNILKVNYASKKKIL